jgi:glycosyltransferase involved in cell wall biosynthesis
VNEVESDAVPKLSVGLPVYNGEMYLAEAIESVLAQSFTDWQLIICDNASTDSTREICKGYAAKDSRIVYHRNTRNIGLYPNFSRTFTLSRSPYFKWQAHDDTCSPTMFEELVQELECHPDAALAYSNPVIVDAAGHPNPDVDWSVHAPLADPDPAVRFLALTRGLLSGDGPPVPVFTFGVMRSRMVSRSAMNASYMRAHEGLLADLILRGPFVPARDGLVQFRMHENNSGRYSREWNPRKWQEILAPRLAGPVRIHVSVHRHHFEYMRSVWSAKLPARRKAFVTWTYLSERGAPAARRLTSKVRGLR